MPDVVKQSVVSVYICICCSFGMNACINFAADSVLVSSVNDGSLDSFDFFCLF